ncbi:hypothetical protein [Nonomuraea sp. GTA35]|uniref:DUF7167 family protein n=1 Tax=Nonomuraea sp. GTA35 TaxID=1676746 RepID=UPI0035C06F33
MSTEETITVRAHVSFNAVGADAYVEIEVPRAEWEAMTEEEQDEYMAPYLEVLMQNHVSSSYHVLDD